ncbi:MAG: undecaprenyldiphospho-muramoylpentapeptide beta-N-acetylglucosaminyltransferase, partial [Alphaproteobacteria bacterium]|nr:undecaprenyldiphospho-muramoylpentapeptide beta-N-acetylglucosaminyltransferase [Alphaproteobacteria bacterium]
MTTADTPARPIVLAAGGTGGHMFPAAALARALLAAGERVVLVTDRRAQAFSGDLTGIPIHRVAAGMPGRGLFRRLRATAELAVGAVQALRLLKRLQPAAVVGFGGYPSVPALWAASRLGLPIVLQEQNALAGRANRLFAPRARAIAAAVPRLDGLREADQAKIVVTGNPVRPAIAALAQSGYRPPQPDETAALLVIGGSQGAHIFAELVPAALALLPESERARLAVVQQCRPEDLREVGRAYEAAGIAHELAAFFTDMPARLAAAHLVIARAGASTIAELAAAGRPAILVPYPYAKDDHQTVNAAALADAGGAWLMPQDQASPEHLATMIAALLGAPGTLARAAEAAHGVARPDAAERLAGQSRVGLVQAPAEAIPMPDGGVDLVTCVYLYHELPRKIRRQAAAEMARVLAPGGRLVFVDSIQRGDRPAFDSILAYFPDAYYEPYYEDYTKDDLVSVF